MAGSPMSFGLGFRQDDLGRPVRHRLNEIDCGIAAAFASVRCETNTVAAVLIDDKPETQRLRIIGEHLGGQRKWGHFASRRGTWSNRARQSVPIYVQFETAVFHR